LRLPPVRVQNRREPLLRAGGRACERQGVRAAGRASGRAYGLPGGRPQLGARPTGPPASATPLCHFVTQLSRETCRSGAVMSFCYTTLPGNPSLRLSYVTLLHNSPGKPAAAAQLCHFVTQLSWETCRSGAVMSICFTTPPDNPPQRRCYVTLLHNSSGKLAVAPQLCHFVTQLSRELRH